MKNKANLNSSNSTANPCSKVGYNDLQPKTQNGTKPNEANLKPILARRPVGVVTSTKTGNSATLKTLFLRNKPNFNNVKFTATTCSMGTYNASQTKTKNGANPNKANFRNATPPVFQKIKKMENEPNCNESDVAASNCYRNTYNDLYHKIRQKNEPKRTQLKPIKANLRHLFHSDTVSWPVWKDEN